MSDPKETQNGSGFSRRSFIKSTSIAAGAIVLLARGTALANPQDGYPGISGSLTTVKKTETFSVTLKSPSFNTAQNLATIQNGFNLVWADNWHGGNGNPSPTGGYSGTVSQPGVVTWQTIHTDAVLKSSNSEVKNRSEITTVPDSNGFFHYEQTLDTVQTWVYGDS